jgi:hypothetical protein
MHANYVHVPVEEAANLPAFATSSRFKVFALLGIAIGIVSFLVGLQTKHPALVWGSFYVSLLFFMGLSFGGVVLCAVFQIVRARWSSTLRRLAEANISFLPVAYAGVLLTYLGRGYLFPWAVAPRAGSEWWMQPNFVYLRISFLFVVLIGTLWYFVKLSLRGDYGTVSEVSSSSSPSWRSSLLSSMVSKKWLGSAVEVSRIQNRLSRLAPLLILIYALIYSLFAFEMVLAMDKYWMSNLFGAFLFVGNVYMAWAVLGLSMLFHTRTYPFFKRLSSSEQRWDIARLTFGFCMVWGYFFISQYLPQWYGNLPEETQWMILRTKEQPWKNWAWMTFTLCFIFPFIVLISRDLKRHRFFYGVLCCVILLGKWTEAYILIMPQLSPTAIPLSFMDIGIFIGFLSAYLLCVRTFLSQVPPVAVGHPLTRGSIAW